MYDVRAPRAQHVLVRPRAAALHLTAAALDVLFAVVCLCLGMMRCEGGAALLRTHHFGLGFYSVRLVL
eukprot:gene12537-biopygen7944